MNNITFKKVGFEQKDVIFSWLAESYIREFWDNTQDHKDDIINFIEGRKSPSSYCDGKYVYWIAYCDGEPYAMIMTIQETHKDDIGETKLVYLSKTGHSYGLDFMIGNSKYLGKGYGAETLVKFISFFRSNFDEKADTFLIDPAANNPRAKHVYQKAGFQYVADFIMCGDCSGAGNLHHLLIKKFKPKVNIQKATINEYPVVQNMARFYVYDLSKECGHISAEWRIPQDGLYESYDMKKYFVEEDHKAYMIKIYDQIAGFVLLNRNVIDRDNNWNMGEFFVLGQYQKQGVGKIAAYTIWSMHPGKWEVSVIPENLLAIKYWERVISSYAGKNFTKALKLINFDKDQPKRVIFSFDNIDKK
jgi:predicted acetyltransferase/RimJ/RimL family protein N-acetyltransferase